ncbi:hypothetical protein ACIPRI_11775 [Variovorax sp. LARHSF232]
MTQRLLSRPLAAITAGASSAGAWAHDGHGLGGAHWHATDAAIFIAAIAAAGVALWLGRK